MKNLHVIYTNVDYSEICEVWYRCFCTKKNAAIAIDINAL